ncbi:IS30 family transposase (plasmid) [Lactiplantibacillus plantarum 2025]|uniref:IS30 family transposase n=1 Tax=Lactiplantibacillus plantarum TaxID=1590 RepID=UPI001C22C047|nr:IS30 family transposase [Lactiplantibacillus plantarum]QXD11375.1 IS30 family transposase [Lactiplantibacillus plantarum 2025]QXD12029.1 IS30 family transposase [Lactiplantibacillus plantarum 2025]QXD12271.1 IS30 family transposase [Lactiplantibacillus plantarum 2025]QXD12649.1 IS30 family transposase [Lactiplantibacillus plantarum 2025]QXD12903.1 IS30 family transposase [Lactiplantibacillus plantarum 2025]
MTYTHLTIDELTTIYSFWKLNKKAYRVAPALHRSAETVYRIYRFLDAGGTLIDYQQYYRRHKQHCGRKPIQLAPDELVYIQAKIQAGWQPDTIINRHERSFSCGVRTLYRIFKRDAFGLFAKDLPMHGQRHPNGYVERRGKAGQLGRDLKTRYQDYPNFKREFGHLEGDTVQGKNHQGAVTTLVERQTKVAIVLNSHTKSSQNVNRSLAAWLTKLPRHLFKSITFDNGKEFAGWRTIANQFDLNIYFAAVGAPNQRGLNENTNNLLRKDGLHHDLIMDQLSDEFVQAVASRRNHIPRKSLNYQTPLEAFVNQITDEQLKFLT